jgi:hypothetical protein
MLHSGSIVVSQLQTAVCKQTFWGLSTVHFDPGSRRGKRRFLRSLWLAAALLLVFPEGSTMGLFTRLVLFSPVSGVVLKDGVPVENAEVRQEITFSDGQIPSQHAVSDAAGSFHFPVVDRSAGFTRWVPHQPVILQRIVITYGGIEYEAWRHTRNSYGMNSELDGRPLRLECDLARQPDFEGTHYGICTAVDSRS